MATNTDACKGNQAPLMFQCGGKKHDHTECCKQKGVHTTTAGDKCLVFCNVSPSATAPPAGPQLFPCLAKLPEVNDCFLQYSVDHPGVVI
jgi:hypothetical protein